MINYNKQLSKNIRKYYSTSIGEFDYSLLSEFTTEGALAQFSKKEEKKEPNTVKLYFNLADKVFDNKKDVVLIANSLRKAVTERVIDTAEDYNFQIYLLVTGKKVITDLLEHLNNMNLSGVQYSVLSRIKKRYNKMQENLSKLLLSAQVSPDLSNDTKNIKFLIENILKVMKKNHLLKDLPISTLVIAKRVGDAVISENDIIINTTYQELKVLIDKSPKTVKTTPIKVIEKSNEDKPESKPVKKSSRTKTPRASKSTEPIKST